MENLRVVIAAALQHTDLQRGTCPFQEKDPTQAYSDEFINVVNN